MDRSPSFGSIRTSSTPDEDSLSLRLPSAKRLDLLVRITRRIIMQKARPHPPCGRLGLLCKLSVSGLFHSPSGVLFTFPSRYLCTIGFRLVFSLGGWSPQLPIGFHVSDGTRELPPFRRHGCRLQDYHLLWWAVPGPFNYPRGRNEPPTRGSATTPQPPGSNACRLSHRRGLGCCPFARRY